MARGQRTDRELVERLRRGLEGLPRVMAGYVFGSRAAGRAHAQSDIDVAVLLEPAPAPHETAGLIRSLAEGLGREVAADRLDLVLLNDAPPVLAFQILKHGELVMCRDEVALHRFKVATYRRHADREPTERLFREATKRRAQREAGRG